MARWELSRRLATRRRELGLGVSAITSALDFTRNYWSAVENDRTLIAEDKLRLLFDVLRFDPDEQEELLQLRRKSKQRGWWDDYPNLIDDEARRFFGLENGARTIRAYESNLIPGLLQTPDYSRAILESSPTITPAEVGRRLTLQERRQQLLTDPELHKFIALISEATLLQQVDGPDVQMRQLRHLLELLEKDSDSLDVFVVPFTRHPGAIANSSTLLLVNFNSPHLPDIAWQEGVVPLGIHTSEGDEFYSLEYCWNEGLAQSLDRNQSISLIEQSIDAVE